MGDEVLKAPFVLDYAYKRSTGPVIGRFLTGLREGRIEGVVCSDGRVLVPAREYDVDGAALGDTWADVSSEGEVLTWTEGWALVRLDGSDSGFVHRLLGPVKTGDRVRIRWAEQRRGHITDIEGFEPLSLPERELTPSPGGGTVTRFKQPTRLEYSVSAGPTTEKFLRHVLEDRLVGQRCPQCTKVYVPPRGACPTCAVTLGEDVHLPDVGVVTTFSVIHIPFEGQRLPPPYACAHILLEGADVPLLHIVGGCPVDEVRVGMRVRAVWDPEKKPTLGRILYFQPEPS